MFKVIKILKMSSYNKMTKIVLLFLQYNNFDFFVYSVSGCCCSVVPALCVISVQFDAVGALQQLVN